MTIHSFILSVKLYKAIYIEITFTHCLSIFSLIFNFSTYHLMSYILDIITAYNCCVDLRKNEFSKSAKFTSHNDEILHRYLRTVNITLARNNEETLK